MNQLDTPRFFAYALSHALRHPRKPIVYLYCRECQVRLPGNAEKCPKCHKSEMHHSEIMAHHPEAARGNPEVRQESAIPWWGSVLVIVIGIACWMTSACLTIKGLDEAGRALVYVPLGSLFGMSLRR